MRYCNVCFSKLDEDGWCDECGKFRSLDDESNDEYSNEELNYCCICGEELDEDGWCSECHEFRNSNDNDEEVDEDFKEKFQKPVPFSTVDGDYDNTGYTLYLFDTGYEHTTDWYTPYSSGDAQIKNLANIISVFLTAEESNRILWMCLIQPFIKVIVLKKQKELKELIDFDFSIKDSNSKILIIWRHLPVIYKELQEIILDNGDKLVRIEDSVKYDNSLEGPATQITACLFAVFGTKRHLIEEYMRNLLWVVLLPIIQNHYEIFSKLNIKVTNLNSISSLFYNKEVIEEISKIIDNGELLYFDEEGEEKWDLIY